MKRGLIMLLLVVVTSGFSQTNPTTFANGIRIPTATEVNWEDSFSFPVYDEDGIIKYYLPKSEIPTGEGGTTVHNDLTSIQGGTTTERYHLTLAQWQWVAGQMWTDHSVTHSTTPATGERGLETVVTVNFNIQSNDDTINSASYNQGIGSVLEDVGTGNKTRPGGIRAATTTYALSINYTGLDGVPTDHPVRNVTYTAYTPQWAGWSSATDFTTYNSINTSTDLQKFLQSNSVITKAVSPTSEYVWFILSTNNRKIFDANNFEQTVGAWDNPSTEFWLKPLTLTLADGTTEVTVYLYRSRTPKTATSFNYRSANP